MFVVHLHSGKKTVIKIKIYPYEIACIIWINIGNTASYLSFVPSTKNDMTKCLGVVAQSAIFVIPPSWISEQNNLAGQQQIE